MVRAVVTELHLDRLCAGGEPEQLMAQADTEHRDTRGQECADRRDGVIARLGIAWAVREENAIRIHGQDVCSRCLRGHHGDAAAVVGQHAQNVALHAVVVRDHMQTTALSRRTRAFTHPVGSFVPLVGLAGGDYLRQVHSLEAGERTGRGYGRVHVDRLAGHDATGLRAFAAQYARQAAGVDIGDRHRIAPLEEVAERLRRTPARMQRRQIADHETGSVDASGFHVLRRGAVVANMGIRQGHDLTGVRRVGQDFLIAGHGRVEHDFTDRLAIGANGNTFKYRAIFEGKYSGRRQRLILPRRAAREQPLHPVQGVDVQSGWSPCVDSARFGRYAWISIRVDILRHWGLSYQS